MTLEELKTARARLASGQHVVNFRSANGKSVTYGTGDIGRLDKLIADAERAASATKRSRSRRMVSSKGL